MRDVDKLKPVLGIIVGLRFGVGDRGTVCGTMDIMISETVGFGWTLSPSDVCQLIAAHGVGDINKLVGKTVWVTMKDTLIGVYKGPAVIPNRHTPTPI